MRNRRFAVFIVTIGLLASCREEPTGTLSYTTSTSDPVCNGITHLWPGEGTTTDVRGANNGTAFGGMAFAQGLVGQAFSFDGVNDYLTVGDVLEEQAGTVEFWLNRGAVAATAGDLVSDLYFGAFAGSSLADGQSTPTFYVRQAGDLLWDIGNNFSNNAGPLSAGVWHHLAMTWSRIDGASASEVRVYVDGTQVGAASNATISSFPQPIVGAFTFGAAAPSQHATALIDELTIYNRALAPAEIATIHAAGAAGKCAETPPPPLNQAPIANAGGPYQTTEQAALELDGSVSSDPDGDALTYAWDFGDGSAGSGVKPTHAYVTAGSYTVTLTVDDGNGGSNQATTEVHIRYPFAGFFAPVDHPDIAVNRAKAGSAIPVKFGLGGDKGLAIFRDGYPKPVFYDCVSGVLYDQIEVTVAASTSFLSYDAASGRYNYTWKTDKGWAGKCLELHLGLRDGSNSFAKFQFTK